MDVNTVQCPRCSGLGHIYVPVYNEVIPSWAGVDEPKLKDISIKNPCPLCFGEGEVHEAVATRYWERMKKGHE